MDYTRRLESQATTINRFKLIYLLKASYEYILFVEPQKKKPNIVSGTPNKREKTFSAFPFLLLKPHSACTRRKSNSV